MRKLMFALLVGSLLGSTSGCLIPMYSGDPGRRTEELIYTSENLRLLNDEWERAWLLDMPDHSTPFRMHGGII